MAREFNGSNQYGTATLNTAQKAITQLTFAWWEYLDSNAQYKRPYHMAAGAFAWRMEFDNGWGYVFVATQNSSDGKWSIAKPSTGSWHHICVTYDGSSTSNDPIIYVNGVSQTVTERNTPSGTLLMPDGTLTIAQATGGGQNFDGRMAEFAMWGRVLSPSEVAALGKGVSPIMMPQGLLTYFPLMGNASPEVELMGGSNLTLTNTPTKASHPQIFYPAHFYFPAATAGGGTLYTKELSDTIGLSDNIAKLVGKVQTDAITLTSTIASVATLYRTLTDSITLSSAVTSLRSTFISTSDSISFSSTVTAAKTTSKTLSDSIGLTEAFSLIKSFGRSFSDSIGLSSAIEALVVGTKGLSDSISLTDTLSIILNSLSAGIPGKFKDAIRSIQKTGSRVVGVFKNNDPEGISFQKERPDADEVR